MNSYYDQVDKLRSDIHLNRLETIERDKRTDDYEEQLLQSKKEVMNLCLYIQQLHTQLQRMAQLNPSAHFQLDEFQLQLKEDGYINDSEKDQILEMAQIMGNSVLLKSYEQIIQQYEADFEKKNNLIRDMERELQQIQYENSNLAQQLYNIKVNVSSPSKDQMARGISDTIFGKEGIGRDEKEQLVELLKRNHDIVLEKYELQKQRNDGLEKMAMEKEKLYNEIKLENDQLANSNYKLQRSNEDLLNDKRISESKLRALEQNLRTQTEEARQLRSSQQQFESKLKLLTEEYDILQKSFEELSMKKQSETELLTKEISTLTVQDKESKLKIYQSEKELGEIRDHIRLISQELDSRTRENEHLVSLLEDQEQKLALYEQKEKSIQQLAAESKKRIEESNSERDRVLLKEQQYLRQIARLEDRIKQEAQERQERHDKLIESLRMKQKNILDQKDDEISDLQLKLSDSKEMCDKFRVEKESLRNELDKVKDQIRSLKDDASLKYETYNKQLNQSETLNEDKMRQLQRDNERFKEENETMRKNQQQTQIILHEQEIKLEGYMRDYERYFEENKRLRELVNSLREEKDSSYNELKRLKNIYHDRVNELNDECNLKMAHLENQLLEAKEKHKYHEEKGYEIMMMQERMMDKLKNEHKLTVEQYERIVKSIKTENKFLHDKQVFYFNLVQSD